VETMTRHNRDEHKIIAFFFIIVQFNVWIGQTKGLPAL
jgi:hypothetical protein